MCGNGYKVVVAAAAAAAAVATTATGAADTDDDEDDDDDLNAKIIEWTLSLMAGSWVCCNGMREMQQVATLHLVRKPRFSRGPLSSRIFAIKVVPGLRGGGERSGAKERGPEEVHRKRRESMREDDLGGRNFK